MSFITNMFIALLLLVTIFYQVQGADYSVNDATTTGNSQGTYIGVYIAVFIGGFPFLYGFMDFLGLFDGVVLRLGKKAEHNFMKELEEKNKKAEKDDKSEGKIVVDGIIPTADENDPEKADEDKDTIEYEKIFGYEKNLCGRRFPILNMNKDFLKSLISGRCYYDTYDGIRRDSCFFIAGSLYSDAMFFFFNSHSLFSMAGALQGNPFSRYERRMAFIVRHGLAFLISVAFFLLPLEENLKATLNTVVVAPLTVFVNTSYYLIVACPCLQGEISSPTLRAIFTFFEGSASLIAHICCLISIVWIIVAGALTSKSDNFQTLSKYLYQVFVFGLGTELVLLWLKFFASSFCIKFNVLGVNVFTISDWFDQMLQYQNYNPNKRWFGFPLILTVEIWTKGEPIQEISDDVVDVDIEMGKIDDSLKSIESKPLEVVAVSSTTELTLPQPPSTDNSPENLPPHPSLETKETKEDAVLVQQVEATETKNDAVPSTETVTSIESVAEHQIKTTETKNDAAASTETVTSVESVAEQEVETAETKNEALASIETVVTTNDDDVEKPEAAEEVDDVVEKTTESSSSKKKKKKNKK